MAKKDDVGRVGERLAAEHLERLGHRILERNWRCSQGEIDIVSEDGRTIVFVEVKTRSSTAYGHPFEAITREKFARMRRLAAAWCAESRIAAREGDGGSPAPWRRPLRLDAVAVLLPGGGAPVVEHRKGLEP